MSDKLRTVTVTEKLHGGFGLAVLIAGLATIRVRAKRRGSSCMIYSGVNGTGPVSRQAATDFPKTFRASAEYYAICDRIARGEKP